MTIFKWIFLLWPLSISSNVSANEKDEPAGFDPATLELVNQQTIITATPLKAINLAYAEFEKLKVRYAMDYYLIGAKKDATGDYLVVFTIPRSEQALGGGTATYRVDPTQQSVELVGFSK